MRKMRKMRWRKWRSRRRREIACMNKTLKRDGEKINIKEKMEATIKEENEEHQARKTTQESTRETHAYGMQTRRRRKKS